MSGVAAAVIGGGLMVGSSVMQASAARDAAKAQKESYAAQQKMASANAAKGRLEAIRRGRMEAANIAGSSAAGGLGQASSGVAGSISVIGSQVGSNIGNINIQEGFAEMASVANQSAADAGADMAKWQAVGNIGSTIFSAGTARIG